MRTNKQTNKNHVMLNEILINSTKDLRQQGKGFSLCPRRIGWPIEGSKQFG